MQQENCQLYEDNMLTLEIFRSIYSKQTQNDIYITNINFVKLKIFQLPYIYLCTREYYIPVFIYQVLALETHENGPRIYS